MPFRTVNPTTGELLLTVDPIDDAAVEARLTRAVETFQVWRRTPFKDRAALLHRVATILHTDAERWARLMTLEMGKPIRAAVAEAQKCAWVCRYYADHGAAFLAPEPVATDARHSEVRYEPLGPLLAIMPWNFPFWQVFRFAAPALMAGNVVLVKHAPIVPQCAQAIEDIFREAGAPEGLYQNLFIEVETVPRLLADVRIRGATLTGSTRAGRAVAAEAGRNIKKTVLELGGSDPFIVMPSANLEAAVAVAVQSRMLNNGQSCIAAKRFILHEAIADEFEAAFVERVQALTVGDPFDPATDIGPLAADYLRDTLARQVEETVAAGARVLVGGHLLDRPGFFYAPTVLTDIPPGTPARCEELFGPVAALFRVASREEALALANDTPYGLGASVWTQNDAEAEFFIANLEAGNVFVNGLVKSDPRLPFGGVKASGYGRELGVHGIREFVNVKTVWKG
ncbi:succinate-semialdehyde dehydrogenase / glutarate-semialdehyde dehydrogenase [Ardenticatena maritima]|uniref:Succinate-semialdehyde dehydrogenase n=1 Tax=Ardenticatena maritima TaxID=872965 RepID=A0A0N0RFN5_9CHLR|nr:NAD-dependent succinate-semialdehyde dehydrogenase [Ardenticatena maritima]KPL88005.1 succinate-semialdehyde dehydrogenase [Ardenticatena maritima]GAP63627.1 succinate-semialdehyde dehydrogenase / glutarate-semialdehyde dehydrogenase [Ardenticatena maritima]